MRGTNFFRDLRRLLWRNGNYSSMEGLCSFKRSFSKRYKRSRGKQCRVLFCAAECRYVFFYAGNCLRNKFIDGNIGSGHCYCSSDTCNNTYIKYSASLYRTGLIIVGDKCTRRYFQLDRPCGFLVSFAESGGVEHKCI